MGKVFRSKDGRLHVVNPSMDLHLQVDLRRRARPRSRWTPRSQEDLRLAAWLIQQASDPEGEAEEAPEELLKRAIDAGLLVPFHEIPGEEPRFRCVLDSDTSGLLATGSDDASPERFQVNDRVWIQDDAEVPTEALRLLRASEDHPEGPEEFGRFDERRPVYWVLDREREFLSPYWPSEGAAPSARRLAEDGYVPAGDDARLELGLAGMLYDPDAVQRKRARIDSWGEQLEESGYAVLRDMVPPLYAASLRRYFRELEAEGFFELDRTQVVGQRAGVYCDVATRHLQRQLTPIAQRLTGESLEPSYTWLRRYLPGAVLERHLDRPQCRWNLSLCADQDPEVALADSWPIRLEIDGEEVAARLGIGDCVIYRGDEIPHWRERLGENRTVTMCFLHFVDEDFEGSLG